MESSTYVFALGGSIVAPEEVAADFLVELRQFILEWKTREAALKLILVVGGGRPARLYQQEYRALSAALGTEPSAVELDWLGIRATHLNAEMVKAALGEELVLDPVVTDPSAAHAMSGTALIAGGWKPGFSTDYDAVVLAQNFGAKTLYNLSNIAQIYTADPKKNPSAAPLRQISWDDLMKDSNSVWTPGANVPFDPVACRKAKEIGLTLITASGRDLANLERLVTGDLSATCTIVK